MLGPVARSHDMDRMRVYASSRDDDVRRQQLTCGTVLQACWT